VENILDAGQILALVENMSKHVLANFTVLFCSPLTHVKTTGLECC